MMKQVRAEQTSVERNSSFSLEERDLTPCETKVLKWLGRGKTNREIGLVLGMKERTVAKHLEHIFSKFNARSRVEVVVRLLRRNQSKL